ncbi:MAG: AMP-binding protein [Candidatus Omnitrophota bacterium]|nr:AMP-binding protein [Candidatus Omnitrophota bacterium]
MRNLRDKFKAISLEYSGRVAIQYNKGNEWGDVLFGEFRQDVERLSASLLEEGIKKHDKIAILLDNRPEWPLIFFSTVSAGAISIPLNPESTREEVENILKDSECKFAFTGESSFRLMEEICRRCPSIKRVISVDSDAFKDAVKRSPEQIKDVEIGGDDPACILYTSGTTAEPKGVVLSHRNLFANCDSLHRLNLVTPDDSVISILPLHHAYSLTVTMLFPFLCGGRIIYPGTMRGETVLEAMRQLNASVFVAVPQIFYSFYQKITETLKRIPFPVDLLFRLTLEVLYKIRVKTGINLPRYFLYGIHRRFGRSMRLFMSGGAKLDEGAERMLFKLGFTILEGYGLTETSPILTANPLKKPKIGSVGLPIPDVELKIIDKDEKGTGEVIVRGPNVMEGYYRRKDLTAQAIKDGWFHTGDLGYIDKDGYLFLTGRLKEVVVLSSGLNIYPEEIEEAYSSHTPVKEMCVFELPAKKGLEENLVLWAVIVPDLEFFRKFGEINLRSVIKERLDNVSRSLPPHKRIMGFFITLEKLPRTVLGKIQRFAVKELYTPKILEEKEYVPGPGELSKEDLEIMESGAGRKIMSYLEEQTAIKRAVTPGDLLELDLGIDSLGRIELASGLEKIFGIKIEAEIVGRAFTVKDLIVGIEALLKEETEALPVSERVITSGPEYWKTLFQLLPKKENLDKIDLKPGFVVWLGCFLFLCPFYMIFKIFFSMKVEGRNNVPESGPYILYVNHTSYLDGFLVATSLPNFPKLDLFFVGFRPYFAVPIIRNLIKIGRIIPLDFYSHFLEALRSCYYVLKKGRNLCLFPEGLRTLNGNINEFKKGFGILAKESKAKLVPVVLEGTYQAWPRTSKFPKRHPIKVRFGKALDPEDMEKEGYKSGAKDGYEALCLGAREALIELKEKK